MTSVSHFLLPLPKLHSLFVSFMPPSFSPDFFDAANDDDEYNDDQGANKGAFRYEHPPILQHYPSR